MNDGNKIVTYDRVVTGFKVIGPRFYLTVRYENSDTGEARHEMSSKWFRTESEATEAANTLALTLQARLREGN
jgi:hypothetical protein